MAYVGGLMIGTAAALFLLLSGRIAGVSGIFGGLIEADGRAWRLAFVLGLPFGAWLASLYVAAPIEVTASPALLVVSGLLVGLGTQIGSGCTSGHGVCGIARWSQRSLVATFTFMVVGAITVALSRGL